MVTFTTFPDLDSSNSLTISFFHEWYNQPDFYTNKVRTSSEGRFSAFDPSSSRDEWWAAAVNTECQTGRQWGD